MNAPAPDPGLDLQRRADRVTALILYSDAPDVDIEIEIRNLRRWCAERLPDRLDLFEMVYVSRFRRLREQFPREAEGHKTGRLDNSLDPD